jgi:colanic acid biosynthesis glycosyl transferase WcaI
LSQPRPRLTALYHFFHPDDVVSARHYDGLCQGLAARGWDITVCPSNRSCRHAGQGYPLQEEWAGVHIRRLWRPDLSQESSLGRIVNAAWMAVAWSLLSLGSRRPDVLLVGTDPILSVAVALPWRLWRPRVRIAHWCFDMYPEALTAANLLPHTSLTSRVLRGVAGQAYQRCDLIADLGPCMRERLRHYGERDFVTLVPWALVEPAEPARGDPILRQHMFGEADLGLLYSGNFGQAHSYREILDLARRLRGAAVELAFAVRGNRVAELQHDVSAEDSNIRFLEFVPESRLQDHLAAADVHLVSLRPEWAGIVVPSKFFGSLAIGRPVIFAGPPESAVACWIREHQIGWVLTPATLASVAADLRSLAREPRRLQELQARCHAVYQQHFARETVLDRWDQSLRQLLRKRRSSPGREQGRSS